MKDQVILSILSKAGKEMSLMDLRKLKDILDSELRAYELSVITTEVIPYTGAHTHLQMYLVSKKLDGMSLLTLGRYERQLTHFLDSIQKPVDKIEVLDIRAFLAKYQMTGTKPSTVATMQSTIRAFFTWLEKEDIIVKSPMRKIQTIKTPKRLPKFLTQKQIELLRLSCKRLRDRAMLEVYYSTGCRISELVNTNYTDIDYEQGAFKVIGKGNVERTVYINEKAMVHLKKYLESRKDDNIALFISSKEPFQRLHQRAIQQVFTKMGKKAGIERNVYPHLLRHSVATTMLRNGTDIATIQKMLGHTSPISTQIYAITDDHAVHEAHKRCT